MYKIALRNGSPVNVGQMMELNFPKGAPMSPGYLVCIVDCQAKSLTLGDCPDAIVSAVNGDLATVMLLSEDIILETKVTSGGIDDFKALAAGKRYDVDAEGVNIGATGIYCQVIDTLDAKNIGDKILVRFIKVSQND
jgi:hypothetical protein